MHDFSTDSRWLRLMYWRSEIQALCSSIRLGRSSSMRPWRMTLLVLLTAFSLVIAPLAPLVPLAQPHTSVAPAASASGANPLADLLAGAGELTNRASDLYNDLFAADTAAAQTGAPGGVSSGLRLWVKSDAGTGTTTNGAAVNTWADQSGNGADMSAQVANREPFYTDASTSSNFNPTLLFNGTTSALELAPFMTGVEAGGSIFSAAANNTPGTGFDNLVVFGIDNPHLGTAASTGKPLGYMNGSSPFALIIQPTLYRASSTSGAGNLTLCPIRRTRRAIQGWT